MKGRLVFIVILVLAALGLAVGGALAFEFTYTSGFQVQNLAGSQADIVLTYYDQTGGVVAAVNDTVTASGSKTYFPLNAVPDGFNGSVVISSNQPLAAITNVIGDSFSAAAAYEGFDQGSTSLLLPLLMQNNAGYNTWFNVQNTGSTDANVSVDYSDGTSVGPYVIAPGASRTFDQSIAGEPHNQAVFSGVVTSSQPVAASVIEESSSIMFAYSGFTGGSTNPVLPLINANNSGYVTGVQIQNGGGSSTNVTVSYTPSSAGTACEETQTIPAGESRTFALLAFNSGANSNCVPLALFVGSGQVTGNSANQPLVAIVNQLGAVNGEAYSGYDTSTASDTAVMPLIMDSNGGYFTGFNVMNVGGGSTDVNCTFTNTSYTVAGTLDPGEAITALQAGQIAPGYVGSGTCTSTSESIVAVVNELGASVTADQLLVYNGINP